MQSQSSYIKRKRYHRHNYGFLSQMPDARRPPSLGLGGISPISPLLCGILSGLSPDIILLFPSPFAPLDHLVVYVQCWCDVCRSPPRLNNATRNPRKVPLSDPWALRDPSILLLTCHPSPTYIIECNQRQCQEA